MSREIDHHLRGYLQVLFAARREEKITYWVAAIAVDHGAQAGGDDTTCARETHDLKSSRIIS